MNRSLFEDIFRDAHVIDLDFSVWDQAVRMVVVAVEATAFPKRRLPIYVVEFQRVHTINIGFGHHANRLESGHYQWNVYGAVVEGAEGRLNVRMSGSKPNPVTTIDCEEVEVRPLENDALDRRFPGWNKPGSPFLRPGVEDLVKAKVRSK